MGERDWYERQKQIPLSNYVPPNVSLAHSFTISKLLATSDGIAASATGILVQEPPVLGTAQALLLLSCSWNVFLLGKEGGEERSETQTDGRAWLGLGEKTEKEHSALLNISSYLCF